ncbi:MAG: cyclic nucleotide-binding domain-containing protein [Dehalococcoidia bacterium]
MPSGALGAVYRDGEPVIRQGDPADCMYVVQEGELEVIVKNPEGEVRLGVLEAGDVFGEMALFSRAPRSATVRALGEARVLSVDKRGFLSRVHEDPSLAFRILEKMSERIRELNGEVVRLRENCGKDE